MPDGGERVLVVEDDEGIRESLRDLLEDEGYTVVLASNAQEGLARLWDSRPGVVLLDLMMPVMDGFGFLAAARGPDGGGLDVPVVVITAAPRSVAAAANADDLVPKPIDVDLLLRTVAKHCARRSGSQ
jgi:CheY-like chemotaxis protein